MSRCMLTLSENPPSECLNVGWPRVHIVSSPDCQSGNETRVHTGHRIVSSPDCQSGDKTRVHTGHKDNRVGLKDAAYCHIAGTFHGGKQDMVKSDFRWV